MAKCQWSLDDQIFPDHGLHSLKFFQLCLKGNGPGMKPDILIITVNGKGGSFDVSGWFIFDGILRHNLFIIAAGIYNGLQSS